MKEFNTFSAGLDFGPLINKNSQPSAAGAAPPPLFSTKLPFFLCFFSLVFFLNPDSANGHRLISLGRDDVVFLPLQRLPGSDGPRGGRERDPVYPEPNPGARDRPSPAPGTAHMPSIWLAHITSLAPFAQNEHQPKKNTLMCTHVTIR